MASNEELSEISSEATIMSADEKHDENDDNTVKPPAGETAQDVPIVKSLFKKKKKTLTGSTATKLDLRAMRLEREQEEKHEQDGPVVKRPPKRKPMVPTVLPKAPSAPPKYDRFEDVDESSKNFMSRFVPASTNVSNESENALREKWVDEQMAKMKADPTYNPLEQISPSQSAGDATSSTAAGNETETLPHEQHGAKWAAKTTTTFSGGLQEIDLEKLDMASGRAKRQAHEQEGRARKKGRHERTEEDKARDARVEALMSQNKLGLFAESGEAEKKAAAEETDEVFFNDWIKKNEGADDAHRQNQPPKNPASKSKKPADSRMSAAKMGGSKNDRNKAAHVARK